MLARASARSIRLSTPAFRPTVLHTPLPRYYSKQKPKKPFEYKPPTPAKHSPTAQSIVGQAAKVQQATSTQDESDSSKLSKDPAVSAAQDEFGTAAQPKAASSNTPTSAEASQLPQEKSTSPDHSTLQDEYQTPPTDGNTTPQSTSPSAIDPAEAERQKREATEEEDAASQINIHDLTKGIPSTLDQELADASAKTGRLELESSSPASGGGRGKGQLPASAYITSADRRRNRLMNYMFAAIALGLLTGPLYLGRNWESEEEALKHPEAPSGWGVMLFINRVKARLGSTLDYYNEPTFPKLLPDPDPAWERPYTLVLSLEDLLVHGSWSREHGWRVAKRPGVDYFLRYLSQYYELVLFTSVPSMVADPVVRKLDPFRIIMWPLFREATLYKNGEYVKDLTYLNRPLNKIITIDTKPSHTANQPENAIILPKWTGDPNDKSLVSLIPFLEYIAAIGLPDTRQVLSSFDEEQKKNIPVEFHKRQQIARQRFEAELAKSRGSRSTSGSSFGLGGISSALGLKSSGSGAGMMQMVGPNGEPELSFGQAIEKGKMLQDQIRERGQKGYEVIEREIRENGEKWLKEMKDEEEKMKDEQLKSMKQGATGWLPNMFGGGGSDQPKAA
ncbi:mitochondrial inner membrane protein required for protein import [Agyrium rufum]|nr:mitochondrial inner membrane protein required for protein import [Agyrium rufum]